MSATCAEVAEQLDEPTAGTASLIRSFVLLEHPGPWGEDAVEQVFARVLGPARSAELDGWWERDGLRPMLVRPHGRRAGAPVVPPRVLVGSCAADEPWIESTDLDGLRALDLGALAAGRPGHGLPHDEPLLLVCTNGSVDRCCAVRGRPLAATLAAAHPDHVLECTHLGGCRFAANLLVLPRGDLHGRLTPEQGLAIAGRALAGRATMQGWRGRTTMSDWAAAAVAAVREHDRLDADADVVVRTEHLHRDVLPGDGDGPAGCDVEVDSPAGRRRVVLRTHVLAPRTSVCDDEPPWPTPVVTEIRPA